MVLARGFGRLTSAAYQPSGGPLPQYPSSCPRGHAWSQRELDVRALIEGLANDWNFRRVPPGRRRQRTRALRPQRKREGFRLEGFLDPIECLCCGAAAEGFVSGFSVKDGCKQHSHDNLQMSRAGGSDRLGRDGLSHPGDRHLPGGAKADATQGQGATDSGAARADRAIQVLCAASLTGPFRSASKPPAAPAGVHLADANPRPTAAGASPHRLLLVAVPAAVPLVPANKANKSRLHGADLSWIGRYSGGRPGVNGMRRQAP
jgi:hypothetical protein